MVYPGSAVQGLNLFTDEEHCKKERDSYPESGIDWSNTVMGETDVQPCPNATGMHIIDIS